MSAGSAFERERAERSPFNKPESVTRVGARSGFLDEVRKELRRLGSPLEGSSEFYQDIFVPVVCDPTNELGFAIGEFPMIVAISPLRDMQPPTDIDIVRRPEGLQAQLFDNNGVSGFVSLPPCRRVDEGFQFEPDNENPDGIFVGGSRDGQEKVMLLVIDEGGNRFGQLTLSSNWGYAIGDNGRVLFLEEARRLDSQAQANDQDTRRTARESQSVTADELEDILSSLTRLGQSDEGHRSFDRREQKRKSGTVQGVAGSVDPVDEIVREFYRGGRYGVDVEVNRRVVEVFPGDNSFSQLVQTVKDKFPSTKADAKRRIAFVTNNQGQRVPVDITTGGNALNFTIYVDDDGASNFKEFLAKEDPTSDMLSVLSTDDNAVSRIHVRATAVNGVLQLTVNFGVYDVYSKDEMQDGEAQTMTPEAFAAFYGVLQRPEPESEESRRRRHDENARVDQMWKDIGKRQKNDRSRDKGKGHRPFVVPMVYVGGGGSLLNQDGSSPVWQPGQLRGKAEYDARKKKKAAGTKEKIR